MASSSSNPNSASKNAVMQIDEQIHAKESKDDRIMRNSFAMIMGLTINSIQGHIRMLKELVDEPESAMKEAASEYITQQLELKEEIHTLLSGVVDITIKKDVRRVTRETTDENLIDNRFFSLEAFAALPSTADHPFWGQSYTSGSNKEVIGKALVLDEIINYIQSLQQQVENVKLKALSKEKDNEQIQIQGMQFQKMYYNQQMHMCSCRSRFGDRTDEDVEIKTANVDQLVALAVVDLLILEPFYFGAVGMLPWHGLQFWFLTSFKRVFHLIIKCWIGMMKDCTKWSGQQILQQNFHHHTKNKGEEECIKNQNEELNGKRSRSDAMLNCNNEELANLRQPEVAGP
ncbi:hypothetical protein SSX86_008153 [Deinandra increscens subsp. villosa]|uniref:Uncharacterized protein n=1 Tax=Deinandra increscens subsp. villosa TaxID=3103831 RepID=A0AAP0DIJ3_9ASTR